MSEGDSASLALRGELLIIGLQDLADRRPRQEAVPVFTLENDLGLTSPQPAAQTLRSFSTRPRQ
jgi:hypothetical protein